MLDRIGEVHIIRESTLTYSDALEQTAITVSNLALDRKGVVQREFSLACDLKVQGRPVGGFTDLTGHWEATGNAYADTLHKRFAVTGAEISFPFELVDSNGRKTSGALAAHLTGDTAKETLALKPGHPGFGQCFAIRGFSCRTDLSPAVGKGGRVAIASENTSGFLSDLNLEAFLTAWMPPSSAAVSFSYALNGQGLILENLAIRMANNRLRGRLAVKDFKTARRYCRPDRRPARSRYPFC